MPADHFRKAAIRRRMAATGETYGRAAYAIDHPPAECRGTGPENCPEPDCCTFDYVSICQDCDYVFGATGDDPGDGSCPNGCGRTGPEPAWPEPFGAPVKRP